MSRSLFSPSWHSVAELKPRLVPQARVHRHVYRQQLWYVVQDQTGGRYHRLTPAAYALLTRMDGQQTVQAIWEQANAAATNELCTQSEVVDLLVQLHASDLLQANSTPDSAALFERYKKKRREPLKQWLLNPMSLKLPLINPDDFLGRWVSKLAWCFSRMGALLWLIVVMPALVLAVQHWGELTNNLSDRVLSSSNLLVMAIVFPIVKLLHELGHGFAARSWGGSVPQMGLMFLIFAPVPYVDASSSSAFPSKYKRAVVAAAGMLVELFVAALAMYVWLLTEPGIVRAIAFNTMVIAGVSTLIVNGNPLLRYDAYYILADLIEMPNLAQRGQKYLTYLWDHYVFGAKDQEPLAESRSEKRWLVFYTPLAWCYRTFVTISIILFIAGEFFIFGVLLALWSLGSLVGVPLWKSYKHVTSGASLQRRRPQALRMSMGLGGLLLIIGFAIPLPLYTRAEGVIWLPDQAILHAGGNGFFQRWLVVPGSAVNKGDPLYVLEDRQLDAELAVSQAKVDEAEATYHAEQFSDPVKAAVSLRQLEQEQQVLRRAQERAEKLIGYAETAGTLVAPKAQDMPGNYYKKGDLIGYALNTEQLIVRVVVPQDDIYLVRTRLKSADLRLTEALHKTHSSHLVRSAPGGVEELPTAALGLAGGGAIPTSPNDPNGLKTMQRVFMLDLSLPPEAMSSAFGERVHVRFNHGFEPIAFQGLRRLRQLFLSRFGV